MLLEYLILDNFVSNRNNPYTCQNDDEYNEISMWIHKALKAKMKSMYLDVKISKKDVKEVFESMVYHDLIDIQNTNKDNSNVNSYYTLSKKGEVYFINKYVYTSKYTDQLCNVYNHNYLGNISEEYMKVYRYIDRVMRQYRDDMNDENGVYKQFHSEGV